METKELVKELIKHKGKTPIAWGLDGSHYKLSDAMIDNIIETLEAYERLLHRIEKDEQDKKEGKECKGWMG